VHDVTAAGGTVTRCRRHWWRTAASLAPYIVRTTPWLTLIAGCASGTAVLAAMAHVAKHSPISQGTVRVTLLPAVAAMAFTPHLHFRPLVHTMPVPTWITAAGQTLLAIPVLALTCWVQLALMSGTEPASSAGHLPAVYPLLAQLTGWSVLAVAIAACCERSRYAALSGAIAVPVTFAIIAVTTFSPTLARHLLAPPANPHTATTDWYVIAAAAIVMSSLAIRDQWLRYTRALHL
jgi:hypothetical protein